ncbi:hypothetical protein [Nonomuraea cavernae]|uniref:hypothetical protein n=1 Tax=Nonomuraea cavernae TaxID=2045107 RepID=UPI00166793AC|nr:hypothetical protein [Nonomuraea cavernae]MCA2189029.1 hypothetical protein [Nonomuraea cavernae]
MSGRIRGSSRSQDPFGRLMARLSARLDAEQLAAGVRALRARVGVGARERDDLG